MKEVWILRRRMEHRAIPTYKLLNNHFCSLIPVSFNGDFHGYNTRSRNHICKSSATRRWGRSSSVMLVLIPEHFRHLLTEVESLNSFKHGLSKVIL